MKRYMINFALKEAFDTLPAAVCYCTQSGTIRLCNAQMHALYRKMTGSDLQNRDELMHVITHPQCSDSFHKEGDVFLFEDGQAWEYAQNDIITEDGETYTEIRFTDVSELYEKQKQLRKQSDYLKDMYASLHELNEKRMRMKEEQEILELKLQIHDSMNTGMTAIRQLLEGNGSIDESEAVSQLRRSVRALAVSRKQESSIAMEEFIHDASIMGVEVICKDTVQIPLRLESTVTALCREACINAARHGDATKLWIDMKQDSDMIQLSITDNGNGCQDHPLIRGGLKDLSSIVEQTGGSLSITQTRPFTINAVLKTGGNTI